MEFLTIGARLHASASSKHVAIAYFLTDRRPGEDLSLTTPIGNASDKRTPVTRDGLETAIGDRGQVFENRASYQRAVDDRLLGLHNRYEGLMNLLISLRQPKLSEKLDLERLVAHLGNALPPINDDSIRLLADALESLKDDEAGLDRLKQARVAVTRFLRDYRTYATIEARFAADRVRAKEEAVRQSAARLRAEEANADRASAEVERLTGEIATHQQTLGDLDGQIAAHLETPEMRAAEQLRAADAEATRAETEAVRFDEKAAKLESELAIQDERLDAARVDAQRTMTEFEESRAAATAAAARASFVPAHEALLAALEAGTATAGATIERAVADRRKLLDSLAIDARDLAGIRSKIEEARRTKADAEARRNAAQDAEAAAAKGLDSARESLVDAMELWAAGLVELVVDRSAIDELLDAVSGGRRALDAGAAMAATVRAELSAMKGALEVEQTSLGAKRKDLEVQRAAIIATHIARPHPDQHRPGNRDGRPGAPFYEVVDFAPGLAGGEAAGLEAALEASGILDAWVLPDGGILGGEFDAAVSASHPVVGTSLSSALIPAGDAVPAAVVAAILDSIALGKSFDAPWVSIDGAFSLGSLAGRLGKAEAAYIGAGAQAATRARRIAEIDAALAQVAIEQDAIAERRLGLTARELVVSNEIATMPSDAPFVAARRELRELQVKIEQVDADLVRQANRERDLAKDEAKRTSALAEKFAGLGFPAGMTDIGFARESLADYRSAASALAHTAETAERAGKKADETAQSRDQIALLARSEREAHKLQAAEARRLSARVAEIRGIHGISANAAIARLSELRSDQSRTKKALEEANHAFGDAREARGRMERTLEELRGRLAETEGNRTEAASAFGRFAVTPVFELATNQITDGDPRSWAVRRIVELARNAVDTSDRGSFDQQARNAAVSNVHARFGELHAEIGTDFALAVNPTPDGLLLVDAQHEDERISIAALDSFLEVTIAEQESQLDTRSREILKRYLFEGVGQELGDRIREARSLVERMNTELAKCPTASGIRIYLRWELGPAVSEAAAGATNLLLIPAATLNENDRTRIVEFLQGRVTSAREQEASQGFGEALVDALDYRHWFEFTIEEVAPTGRHHRLNSRDFPTGSGGEKSVTLHLPLFAAVAAYYTGDAAKAPRLFFLDEAFAGIDRPMRGSMMGFIKRFDLDFVITTPDDWSTYAELDGTAIYQLYRDPAERGIYAQRWVWTGKELLDENALRELDEVAG
jgi:uncharacterized protein (TIGR02680 family)